MNNQLISILIAIGIAIIISQGILLYLALTANYNEAVANAMETYLELERGSRYT